MIALFALAAAAQTGFSPQVRDATSALAQCAAAALEARASGPGSAEAVADAALASCPAQQQRLWDGLGASVGALSDEEKVRFLAPVRVHLARLVSERRGLTPRSQNEVTAASDCIRAKAPAVAAGPEPEAVAVDQLLEQCRGESEAVRAMLVRERGEASADRIMPGVLTTLRRLALQQLQQARRTRLR